VQAKSTGFIAYYRVSTDRQGRSGLGLEAQRAAVGRYLAGIGGILIAEHTEVETGRRNDRPELQKALAACRKHKARLVIAKLDRLSRNVAFIATMMDSGVEFVACDNPHATRLTLHMRNVSYFSPMASAFLRADEFHQACALSMLSN
jgi:DNA invertase Pin-like site-specific DNA recombinase